MASVIARVQTFLNVLESRLQHMLRIYPPAAHGPALAVTGPTSIDNRATDNGKSLLESIIGDGMFYAVPKSRRTRERKKTRMFGIKGHFEDALPKRNIVACLECGHWHEVHTICGNCYEHVKEETNLMKEKMNHDDFYYKAPEKEVVYVYEGEEKERPMFGGKYIVEMPKKRPQWWSKNLLVKGRQS